SSTDELVEIAKVAGKYGGTYASHMRDEGQGIIGAINELITISEKGGLPGEIFHLKVAYKPGWGVLMDSVRQVVEGARARGPDIETALRFPWTSIGSDAGAVASIGQVDPTGLPHPRSFGNFPRVIAKYVKERHVLTLPEAVRKMTGWPATRMRLANRGTIAVGN